MDLAVVSATSASHRTPAPPSLQALLPPLLLHTSFRRSPADWRATIRRFRLVAAEAQCSCERTPPKPVGRTPDASKQQRGWTSRSRFGPARRRLVNAALRLRRQAQFHLATPTAVLHPGGISQLGPCSEGPVLEWPLGLPGRQCQHQLPSSTDSI